MVMSDKAAGTIALFHRQWLDVSDLPDQSKDATVYPRYNAALGDAMMQELALFTDYVVAQGRRPAEDAAHVQRRVPAGGAVQRLRHDAAVGLHGRARR